MTSTTNQPNSPDPSRQTGTRESWPARVERYLTSYVPQSLTAEQWAALADVTGALVTTAGRQDLRRVESDLTTLTSVAARLLTRGRPLTLDEVLSDAALLDYDLSRQRAGVSDKTRKNQRGTLRRLQAAHHGVPWRKPRRPDGARIADLPSRAVAAELARLLAGAQDTQDPDAAAFRTAVATARAEHTGRSLPEQVQPADQPGWAQARAFAGRHGVQLSYRWLTAAVVHRVLLQEEPLAVLLSANKITRRNLDLGLTHAAELPHVPSAEHRRLLRGV